MFDMDFGESAVPSLSALMINLAVGVALSLVLRWHFRTFGSTLSNRDEFAQVFPFILLTTVLVSPCSVCRRSPTCNCPA